MIFNGRLSMFGPSLVGFDLRRGELVVMAASIAMIAVVVLTF
jgi:hypothetical protein